MTERRFESAEANAAARRWWWFEFMTPQGKQQASMGAPNKRHLFEIAQLEKEHSPEVLNGAVYRFLRRRDEFMPMFGGNVRNMWGLFLSQSYAWIPLGREEVLYREKNDGAPSMAEEDADYE